MDDHDRNSTSRARGIVYPVSVILRSPLSGTRETSETLNFALGLPVRSFAPRLELSELRGSAAARDIAETRVRYFCPPSASLSLSLFHDLGFLLLLLLHHFLKIC